MLDGSIMCSHQDHLRKRSPKGKLQSKPSLDRIKDNDVWVGIDGYLSDRFTPKRYPSDILDPPLVPEFGTSPELQGGSPLVIFQHYPERV